MDEESRILSNHLTGKFITEYEKISPSSYFYDFSIKLADKLGAGSSLRKSIANHDAKSTAVKLLDYEGEPATFDFNPETNYKDTATQLKILNLKASLNDDLQTVKTRKCQTRRDLLRSCPKYALYQFAPLSGSHRGMVLGPPDMNGITFVIKIYRPFVSESRVEDIKIQQEIELRGNQTLLQLEMLIQCHLDYCGLEDVSDIAPSWNNVALDVKNVKRVYPASFFFIGNTFYVNGPDNVDLSGVVKDFLEKNGLGLYSTAKGKDFSLANMTLQVGRPYLYQHLGQCEHVFMVSDIRMRASEDRWKGKNSLITAVSSVKPKTCMLCAQSAARWLVSNFQKLTLARAFLCHRCFLSYCYIDGRKAGDFQAYHYLDPAAIL